MSTAARKRLDARAAFLKEEHLRVLQRLVRLRVATAAQLARLADPFVGKKQQTVWMRLRRMETHGLIRSALLRPQRGAYSPVFYQCAYGGLDALGRAEETNLLKRPRQHILEFLVLRNELYASARAAGWRLASPVLVPEADQAHYLELYIAWAKAARRRHLDTLRARGASVAEIQIARLDYERVEKFAPRALTFDFLMRLGQDGVPSELALLIVDDPRRSIRAQAADLPSEIHPGLRLVLRDHLTRYDLGAGTTYRESRRLAEWRLALTKRYTTLPFTGEQLLHDAAASPLFPDLWAVRTAAPKVQ